MQNEGAPFLFHWISKSKEEDSKYKYLEYHVIYADSFELAFTEYIKWFNNSHYLQVVKEKFKKIKENVWQHIDCAGSIICGIRLANSKIEICPSVVKLHDVIEILEEVFDDFIRNKDPENPILMCETDTTNNTGELLVTFTNIDLNEDKYIIKVSLKE